MSAGFGIVKFEQHTSAHLNFPYQLWYNALSCFVPLLSRSIRGKHIYAHNLGSGMLRVYLYLSLIFLLAISGGQGAYAQCILANPSFELGGSSGEVIGGWTQTGIVGATATATHGHYGARVSGPNTGDWDFSCFWQSFDTGSGEQWCASVKGWHSSTNPLTGGSRAILRIEWRNPSGSLIDYELHTVADASTPLDEVVEFYVESQLAPSGTATTHILVAVLQDPAEPSPDAYFDEVTFYNMGPPTQDDIQWNDFPGGRSFSFSGYDWRVKGPGYYGPGPNLFCDTESCTWVDVDDRLHMTIQEISGSWYSTEITLVDALGYGDYIFTTMGQLDAIDPHTVLGMFTWEYGSCWDNAYLWWGPYNEFDIEFSYWTDPGSDIGQFVAQPYDFPGNISKFDATFGVDELTSHAFLWLSDRVECRSWRGGPDDEASENMIHTWTYTGPHIPRPEQPRVHINLWQVNGPPAVYQEVVIDEFTFIPEDTPTDAEQPESTPASHLAVARPNPFNACATIKYTIEKGGITEITVYNVSGRQVRTLVNQFVPAGVHEVVWDGRNDSGGRVASGLYLYRLRADEVVETRKMILLR